MAEVASANAPDQVRSLREVRLLETLAKFDTAFGGKGLARKQLTDIIRVLDATWTDESLSVVFSASGVPEEGPANCQAFVRWLYADGLGAADTATPAGTAPATAVADVAAEPESGKAAPAGTAPGAAAAAVAAEPDSGEAAPAGTAPGTAVAAAATGPESSKVATLRRHFLSQAYTVGTAMETAGTSYRLAESQAGEAVFVHDSLGIEIWRQVLDLTPADGSATEVLFHYMDSVVFGSIAGEPLMTEPLWEMLRSRSTPLQREPAELCEQDIPANSRYCIAVIWPKSSLLASDSGLRPPESFDLAAFTEVSAANAEKRRRRILSHLEEVLGAQHANTLAAMNDLAFFLEARGDYQEASDVGHRALKGFEDSLGPNHPSTLTCVSNLAYLVERRGDHTEAEELARRALAGREATLGAEHQDTMISVYNLAELLEAQQKLDEAEQLFRRELEWCKVAHGPKAAQTRQSTKNLNRFLAAHKGVVATAAKREKDPRRFVTQN